MSYTKQTWTDGDTTKPVSAARMQHIEDGLDAVANGGSKPFVSDTDPSTTLASGTEYVWFQMDGSGTLLDIVTGKA